MAKANGKLESAGSAAKKKTSMLASKCGSKKKGILANASPQRVFYVCDGKQLKNITELVDALEDMNEGVFKHHVNESKNDFSNWIEIIFEEKELAKEIRNMQNAMDMQRTIMKRLMAEMKKIKKSK